MGNIADFPTLYDLTERVRDLVEQPRSGSGGSTWREREFSREATAAVRWMVGQLIDQDENYQVQETDITVVANAGDIPTADLPTDMTGIIALLEIDSNGNTVQEIKPARWTDMGRKWGRIWLPNQQRIRFTLDEHRTMTVRLVYMWWPLPLAQGVARDGGADSIQMGEHELVTTDAFLGQNLILAAGTGAGQTGTVGSTTGDYDGPTRTATLAANWAGISGSPVTPVANDTIYTTRPPLPIFAEDAYVYELAARLILKLDDARARSLREDRDKYLKDVRQAVSLADRQAAKSTRDDAGYIGFADPLDRFGYGRGPGNW